MAEPKVEPKIPLPPEPKVVPPRPEDVALADAIDSGLKVEYTDQPGGDVTPASLPYTSAEPEPKLKEPPEAKKPPKAGDKPPEKPEAKAPASKEGPVVGESEDGEKPKEGDEDPFKGMKPKDVLVKLLEHPEIGPVLQHWADRAGDAQVATALDAARPTIEADSRQAEAERADDEHFSGMTKEQIAEEIAGDEAVASAYARFQQRKEAGSLPNAEAIAQSSQLYSYASRVAAVSGLIEGSELSDEVKATLKPDNFKHLKAEGIRAWESAVFQALVLHEAEAKADVLLEERWETYQQERMAETDGDRPPMVRGRKVAGTLPDLIGTDTNELFEDAFKRTAQEKK